MSGRRRQVIPDAKVPRSAATQPIIRMVGLPAPFGEAKRLAALHVASTPSTAMSHPGDREHGSSARVNWRLRSYQSPRVLGELAAAFSSAGELGELCSSAGCSSTAAADLCVEARPTARARPSPGLQARIDGGRADARLLLCAARGTLLGCAGQPLLHDLACGVCPRDRELRARRARGLGRWPRSSTSSERRADAVRHRRLRTADAPRLRRGGLNSSSSCKGARLFDRGQLLARDVLDQKDERVAIVASRTTAGTVACPATGGANDAHDQP